MVPTLPCDVLPLTISFERASRWQDLRFALRTLRSTPLVTSAVIVSLALAIGANTTIFSLMDSLLLRTLPVKEPSRLVLLADAAGNRSTWSYPVWDGMRRNHPFEAAAAWSRSRFNLASGGETRFVDGLWASGSFFDTFGVRAIMGRAFSDADDRSSGGPDGRVAVIGYRFWQRHFGGASNVIGQTLPIDGVPFTIVGVMFEPHTEAIRKGKVAKPTEFGKLVTIQESEHQIITGYEVHDRRPADMTLWTPALDRHIAIFDRPPDIAAADRGFASAANEEAAITRGVRRVILPLPGRTTPARRTHERQRWFRRGQRWRVGCEGRISVIKRRHGLRRCRYHGADGTARWVGLGVIVNNLVSTATILNARATT